MSRSRVVGMQVTTASRSPELPAQSLTTTAMRCILNLLVALGDEVGRPAVKHARVIKRTEQQHDE